MRVLVAEDDDFTRKGLVEILEMEGYVVVEAGDGRTAIDLFAAESPELVCLDIMMPHVDGYEVCRRIRAMGSDVPIIFISAKGEEIDTVVGLEMGADDFIVKPFGVREVVARIRAVTRRCLAGKTPNSKHDQSFTMADLAVMPLELRARRTDQVIDLSLRDVKILELLHRMKGQAVDRNTIFNECWGLDYFPSSRSLDQHISTLRKRIEIDAADPQIITTVHGVGYRFDP